MSAPGALFRSTIGCDALLAFQAASSGVVTFAMAPLNSQVQFRFIATDTRDVYYVWINWATISSPGQITVRVETVDTTSGKATGTLYDSNAVITGVTPTAGWQQITFSTPPSTGLTPGTAFAVVILTTTGGTTMTLRGCLAAFGGPNAALFVSADATRADAVESAGSFPILTLGLSEHTTTTEETPNLLGAAVVTTFSTIYGTTSPCAFGAKFIVPANETWNVAAAWLQIGRSGTPAGDLRCRILDTTTPDGVIATATAPVNDLLSVNAHRACIQFASLVTLAAGTYRIVWDSASSVNSSNCYTAKYFPHRTSALCSSGFFLTSGTTGNWTDDNTSLPFCGLWLQNVAPPGGTTLITSPRRIVVPPLRCRTTRVIPLISAGTATTAYVPLRQPARQSTKTLSVVRNRTAALLPGATTTVNQILPLRGSPRVVTRNVVQRRQSPFPFPRVQPLPVKGPVRVSVRTQQSRRPVVLPGSQVIVPLRLPPRVTTRTVPIVRRPANALFASSGGSTVQTVLVTSRRIVR